MEIIITSELYGSHKVYYDDEDHNLVSQFNWHIAKGKRDVFYVRARVPNKLRGKFGFNSIRMHRLIMGANEEQVVDHIDHDGCNNKKSNLRFVSSKESMANTRKHSDGLTGFKGVTFQKKKGLYHARIRVDGKLISLGRSKNPIIAAEKYNKAALKYFGEFAHLNAIP
jgi:hypothetical protein